MSLPKKKIGETLEAQLGRYLRRFYELDDRMRAWSERRFYSLEVELSNHCNQECLYCYNWSRRNGNPPKFDKDLLFAIIKEASGSGVRQLCWLGGEPTLYPHLCGALEKAKSYGLGNVLFTNGTTLTPKYWSQFVGLVDRIVLHLDTVNVATFGQLNNVSRVQAENLLTRICENLDGLLHSGFPSSQIYLYVVLSRPAFLRLRETLEWAIYEKGLATTALYPIVRAGRALGSPQAWQLKPQEIRAAYELRAQVENRPELLLLGPSEYAKHYQLTMAYIDVTGKLMPYAGIPTPSFQVEKGQLSRLLLEHYNDLSFAGLGWPDPSAGLSAPCGGCNNSGLCFGTRTTAFNHVGNVAGADPFCWMIKS